MTDGSDDESGRFRQRRRTRAAIVDATMRLLEDGAQPTITDIAEAADMSRRTVYLHFPNVDQLLIDATVGLLSARSVADAVAAADPGGRDVHARVEAMIRALAERVSDTLPLGRQLIKLTVADAESRSGPRRGYRRIDWIEQAIEPVRDQLSPTRFARLVSALSVTIGWEAEVVLADIRDLPSDDRVATMVWAAHALIDRALAEAALDG
ncbi:TetR/AcrR family transcriptional regulator [Gordonia sp. TBRC 11910]|uniref:TetR/AcrR family transcriptional regulator n=1 Tax=Gordonia asplenii TaxID=2725283 RepID=A0A848L8B8_9ACTN|nr:TetR/AcrR family transcriptional regulator [Gordonia asplenii]NMO04721.1 TetR/AcrR family transcriptional regulator [Gordonia asplenii]